MLFAILQVVGVTVTDSALMDQILANRHLTMVPEEVPPPETRPLYVKSRSGSRATTVEEEEVRVEELSLRSVEVETEDNAEEVSSPKPRSQSAGTLEEGHYQVPNVGVCVCVCVCMFMVFQ